MQTIDANTTQLCEALRMTKQRISQLEKAGVLVKLSRGKWDLLDNFGRYVDFLKSGPAGDEWRTARTKHLVVRTQREQLALNSDRLRLQMDSRDGDLDTIFRDLLISKFMWSQAYVMEMVTREIISGQGRQHEIATNHLDDWLATSRRDILQSLTEHRKKQLALQIAEVDAALGEQE